MATQPSDLETRVGPRIEFRGDPFASRLSNFPWWFLGIILIAVWAVYIISTRDNYQEAYAFIKQGIPVTIYITLVAFSLASIIGLVAGLSRISRNVILRNLGTFYIEVIRGIPMLVLIFYLALVAVPSVVDALNAFGAWLNGVGLGFFGAIFLAIENKNVPLEVRAIIALAVTYGAFMAEVFRAGIQSIGRGQMEAARSLGMSNAQSLRYIILPQAVRNILPALGNDFVAMVKDSSLVSVLAVRDITQVARLYAGRSFRFSEAYTTIAVMYLTMVVILSLLVQFIERRLRANE